MKAWRIILAIAGIALAAFGVFRLLSEIPTHSLLILAVWLAAALVIHDAILEPSVVGLGWLLRRYVQDRWRRYLQTALIMGALITVVALPMIFLRGSQPAAKALLLRNYGANLILLLTMIAIVSLILYAVRVARDRTAPMSRTGSDDPSLAGGR
jgi:hypothetical protein